MSNSLYFYQNSVGGAGSVAAVVAASQGAADTAIAALGVSAPGGNAGDMVAICNVSMAAGFAAFDGPPLRDPTINPPANKVPIVIIPVLGAGAGSLNKAYTCYGSVAKTSLTSKVIATFAPFGANGPKCDLLSWSDKNGGVWYTESVFATYKENVAAVSGIIAIALIVLKIGPASSLVGNGGLPVGTQADQWVNAVGDGNGLIGECLANGSGQYDPTAAPGWTAV